MRSRPTPRIEFAPAIIALVVSVLLVVLGAMAIRTLHQRDAAVREGTMVRLGLDLLEQLRSTEPADAKRVLDDFRSAHAEQLAAVAIVANEKTIAESGAMSASAVEMRAALGPMWRGFAGPGARRFGNPPFRIRLVPAGSLGSADRVANVLLAAIVCAVIALLTFGFLSTRGLVERERRAAAEAERGRLEIVALAGAGLAHRIRNPLAAIKGTAQMIVDRSAEEHTRSRAERIVDASRRLESLVNELLRFAKPAEPDRADVDLRRIVDGIVSAGAFGETVVEGDAAHAWVDDTQIASIVEEFLMNARAADRDGRLEISVRREGSDALIEVKDRGPGLSIAVEKAFEPYVTTQPSGTGLGLPTVQALAVANDGRVELVERSGGGTIARLRLRTEAG